MGEHTEISWTDHTFNPWRGCARVSPGCEHCYAEARDRRWGEGLWGKNAPRHVASENAWRQPLRWDRAAATAGRPALVFCASLADVFEDRHDLDQPRARLFDLIDHTPNLIWQLLTKRPENVLRLAPMHWTARPGDGMRRVNLWPSNVWLGTTVEDQQRADERIPELFLSGARTKFLSCEPLLGRVELTHWLAADRLDWIIVGGESGPHYRPLDASNARNIRDVAHQYDVPFFFKQVGGPRPTSGGHLLDGQVHHAFPIERGTAVAIR